MAVNLTKLSRAGGIKYLMSTVLHGDGLKPAGGLAAYYGAPGTPPGRWLGGGITSLGLTEGQPVTEFGAKALFEFGAHPVTGIGLGERTVQLTPEATPPSPTQVAGYDLTFRIPKSISVLWATASPQVQDQIFQIHKDAILDSLEWMEQELVRTRSGHGGVVPTQTRGLVAARFDHFDTRDGDPHLHSHVVVANKVARMSDGKWLTVDGKALYRGLVSASELHENLLLDRLHTQLGIHFELRDTATASETKAQYLDVVGIPAVVVEAMSARRSKIKELTAQYLGQWQIANPGKELSRRVMDQIDERAWRETRAPKDKQVTAVDELISRWREQIVNMGYSPAQLQIDSIGRPRLDIPVAPVLGDEHLVRRLATEILRGANFEEPEKYGKYMDQAQVMGLASKTVLETVSAQQPVWSAGKARAAAHRLTRTVRVTTPEQRMQLVESIAQDALGMCVKITPTRYAVPATVDLEDSRLMVGGNLVFEDAGADLYTSAQVLDYEQRVWLRATSTSALVPNIDEAAASELIEEVSTSTKSAGGHELAEDQAAAAKKVISDRRRVSAVVGAAGTGKTTTMAAVKQAWEQVHGQGSVLAVAPSAKAAHVLGDSLGISAHTVDRFLGFNGNWGQARLDNLRAGIEQANHKTATAPSARARAAYHARASQLAAEYELLQATFCLKPGSLLIVDEASMTSTTHLAHLSDLVEAKGGKMLLVGDPAQLDAVQAGGMLGWLDRTSNAVSLTNIFRFHNPWEAEASLDLRSGDIRGLTAYDQKGRVKSGTDEEMLDAAYAQTVQDLAAGHNSLLIAATNDVVAEVNMRFTHDLRLAGRVDSTKQIDLAGNMNAALGDTILTRKNDSKITDNAGNQVFNGDLFTVTDIHEGRITATNKQTGTQIVLPSDYVAEHVQLGYSTTVHRCQGVTVDTARLVLPSTQRLTRETLYVAMTRGRTSNEAYVGLMDERAAKEHNIPLDQAPTAYKRLAQALTAEGAERTAHEQIIQAHAQRHTLEWLSAEYEYLAALESKPQFTDWAEAYFPHWQISQMKASPGFDALCATWREAMSLDPQRTARIASLPIGQGTNILDSTQTADLAKLLHSRLDNAIVSQADDGAKQQAQWVGGLLAPVRTTDPTIQNLADQCAALIDQALTDHRDTLSDPANSWIGHLGPAPDKNLDPLLFTSWQQAALKVSIYRERWNIQGNDPLGPRPFDTNRKQDRAWVQAHRAITTWAQLPSQLLDDPHPTDNEPGLPENVEQHNPYQDLPFFDEPPAPQEEISPEDAPQLPPQPTPEEPPNLAPTQYDEHQLRLIEVNTAAWAYWKTQSQASGDWTEAYLNQRQLNLTPALAPAGWNGMYNHLRSAGFTDEELHAAGVVTTTRHGNTIDRFRDRFMIPITDPEDNIIAFTARINPDEDNPQVPKYINSPATAIYSKTHTLQGLDSDAVIHLIEGATPLIVEGAMDSAAITQTLNQEQIVALAPCGTALTHQQLAALRSVARRPLTGIRFGYDADEAGRKATRRAWGLLTPAEAATADVVTWPQGADPAQLVQDGLPQTLRDAISQSRPMVESLIDDIIQSHNAQSIEGRVAAAHDVAHLTSPLAPHDRDNAALYLSIMLPELSPEAIQEAFQQATMDVHNTNQTIEQILRLGHSPGM